MSNEIFFNVLIIFNECETLKMTLIKLLVKHYIRIIKEKGTIVLPDEKERIYFIKEA